MSHHGVKNNCKLFISNHKEGTTIQAIQIHINALKAFYQSTNISFITRQFTKHYDQHITFSLIPFYVH